MVKLQPRPWTWVARAERKQHEALKGHKYTFLKNRENLPDAERQELAGMIRLYPTLGEAYRLKTPFNDLWAMPDKPAADTFLKQWCYDVRDTNIGFMIRVYPSGIKSYVVEYARAKRITLGNTEVLTPAQARDMATDILADVRKGETHRQTRKPPRWTPSKPSWPTTTAHGLKPTARTARPH